jgi:hypothetical protein
MLHRHYIMGLKRGAYHKRGANYTDCATLIRWVDGASMFKTGFGQVYAGAGAMCLLALIYRRHDVSCMYASI